MVGINLWLFIKNPFGESKEEVNGCVMLGSWEMECSQERKYYNGHQNLI